MRSLLLKVATSQTLCMLCYWSRLAFAKQQPQHQMALINNLVIEQCHAMKNNKKNDSFDLKINRKFLKQLTCIDEGSKDGIYSMVLESELNSMLSAPKNFF